MFKPKQAEKEFLEAMKAVHCDPRIIKSHDIVYFFCYKCNFIGQKEFSEAKKLFKNKGFAYQCCVCLKEKHKNRGPEWLANVKAAAQTEAHKERAKNTSLKHVKKYFEAEILAVIEKSGVLYEGDLSSAENSIKITWPDGVTRNIRIKNFMVTDSIERPKTKNESTNHKRFIKDLENNGLTFEILSKNRANITYKGHKWEQYWTNCIDKKCRRKMKNIDNGIKLQALLDSGVPLNRACKMVGVDPNRYYRNRRVGISVIDTAISTKSFEQLIKIENAVYNKKLEGTKYRPDILLGAPKLAIETDGMRFHSEEAREKGYHATKWKVLNDLGYKFLAFSEFEVKEKRPIVDSMISHRLGKSSVLRLKNCDINSVSNEDANLFFESTHLRGSGKGKTIGIYNNEKIVCAIRFYEENGKIYISRFSCALGVSVTGGYSKLLSMLPLDKDIINFVDRRHGSGEHLLSYGFIKQNVHIGFEWTDGYFHWNRRQFLGNTGYDHGLLKFWDYGQVKYVKKASVSPQTL